MISNLTYYGILWFALFFLQFKHISIINKNTLAFFMFRLQKAISYYITNTYVHPFYINSKLEKIVRVQKNVLEEI